MDIVIQGLTHIYMAGTPYERTALSGVNLKIPSGGYIAVVGATGSGKSTLIQHIAGLLTPTGGQVRVGEVEISPDSRDLSALRGRVGVVFQYPEHQLFEETVAKDIAYGPRNLGLSDKEVARRVEQAMNWVGLPPELSGRSPFQLSGGQMRRVAVAGVLAMQPEVLVLDEPTAGLDPAGRRELLSRIHSLHRERGMTVVLVSHNMEEAARYADQIFVMHQGTGVFEGTPAAVFSRGNQLEEWGLEVPEVAGLTNRLNEKLDPPLPAELLTLEELEREIILRWKRGRPR
ncbi:energy-coupling factor transporter ATP-binding protein EcfA2 [Kroppenstedtia guangzhouensis]|jgi:energy-coupling factor transport system ATP-binding protein|uniref:Energy-coupling factor transporter ATP-binding protein EcfA2 n=1 Tax=Kroppenstedtia guangzhouensis TaxID=1274356 RepID=A0ABQ1H098_9BACL|nr:energy-coupling factor transporter ATPase [Kroppenstedtia guangzhouensis]GGA53903.1 energy-coupling factor transporter ATP-binding protein EcfA2 [Kroppenstedtia guangzhouensis]